MSFLMEPMVTPGSLVSLMNGLTSLQAELPDQPLLETIPVPQTLTLYRWRPSSPDAPCLYNMLRGSTTEQKDTARIRDTIVIATRIGANQTDSEQMMEAVEVYSDAYRALVDPNFWDGQRTPPPLKGAATWAFRNAMQSFSDDFGGITLIGIEFIQTFWLDRQNR